MLIGLRVFRECLDRNLDASSFRDRFDSLSDVAACDLRVIPDEVANHRVSSQEVGAL